VPAAQNESTAFSESLAQWSAFAGDFENWVRCIPRAPASKTGVTREDFSSPFGSFPHNPKKSESKNFRTKISMALVLELLLRDSDSSQKKAAG
jgi:hypothetical protein